MSIDFSLSINKKLQSSESENKSAFLFGGESENLAEILKPSHRDFIDFVAASRFGFL